MQRIGYEYVVTLKFPPIIYRLQIGSDIRAHPTAVIVASGDVNCRICSLQVWNDIMAIIQIATWLKSDEFCCNCGILLQIICNNTKSGII